MADKILLVDMRDIEFNEEPLMNRPLSNEYRATKKSQEKGYGKRR